VKIATRLIARIGRLADLLKGHSLCPPAANSRCLLPNLFDRHFCEIASPYPRHVRVTLHVLPRERRTCVRNAGCTTFGRPEIFFHISWSWKPQRFLNCRAQFFAAMQQSLRFNSAGFSASVARLNSHGGQRVDIAIKLNVLAVCAAFVFVSAILLGAF
jgi:hypothetical protein